MFSSKLYLQFSKKFFHLCIYFKNTLKRSVCIWSECSTSVCSHARGPMRPGKQTDGWMKMEDEFVSDLKVFKVPSSKHFGLAVLHPELHIKLNLLSAVL